MAVAVGGMAPLLQVYDMKAALAFYRDALGFEIVQASDEVVTPEGRFSHWCWLKLGGAHLMLPNGPRAVRDASSVAMFSTTGSMPAPADTANRSVTFQVAISRASGVRREPKAQAPA